MTAVGGAIDTGVDLFLKEVTIAFAFDFYLRLGDLGLLEQVDACFGQGVHIYYLI